METIALKEKPCLYLECRPFQYAAPGEVKDRKAIALCHCHDDDECPKARNKLAITMLCFRIMGRARQGASA